MTYDPKTAMVIYRSKLHATLNRNYQLMPALKWLRLLLNHVPDKHDSVKGVNASANLYFLIETAKANGLEPYAYLRFLFTKLPTAETVDAIEALLLGDLDTDQIRTA